MEISCNCGEFKARLTSFPKNTPGRLVCYCRDCQAFVHQLNRQDVLDEFGGTEVIPVYPSEIEIMTGKEHLTCYRITLDGPYRWVAGCCNSPILNTKGGFPWAGIFHTAYTRKDAGYLKKLGQIRARIFGRDALPGSTMEISEKVRFKDMLVVMPFIIRGKIMGKHKKSPFFEADNQTPISDPIKIEAPNT